MLCFVCSVCLILSFSACSENERRFTETYIDYFDTVTTVIGYESDSEEFSAVCEKIKEKLEYYNRLFDIYNEYDGMNNLCTVNKNAGTAVNADAEIIRLISFSKDMYRATEGKLNIALGSVLSLWHDCRTNGNNNPDAAALPNTDMLCAASEHTDISKVIIDDTAGTVCLADEDMRLDVGAVAKGYAADVIVTMLRAEGIDGYALNIGGMVSTLGKKSDGENWNTGIQNPEKNEEIIMSLEFSNKSLVTSGSYQRYYTVDGKRYHHIIDPDTLMPKDDYLSVSVISDSCLLGDSLSTALFNMPIEQGKRLIESYHDVSVLWILSDGSCVYGGEFEKYIV